jgi:Mg2+ and Co2+ transporter CorA
MPGRTARQQATVTTMIDIAAGMAMQTQRIARRDVVELGEVELTDEEDARLGDALLHIERAVEDLQRLRRSG